ncbi:hypothetical protein [Acetivibrio clariflavus]|uniref:hypothetical protein n=1 Tax=Acetivibrio clariflavus TaxID=288965 RepID=UPI00030C62C3|nr:hypothetical protein [Acetivibrio clariflavus]
MSNQSGAKFIYPAFGVALRQNQTEWYYNELDKLFPSVKEKYIKNYGNSYEYRSLRAKELWSLFMYKCNKYGIIYKMNDIIRGCTETYINTQISLF